MNKYFVYARVNQYDQLRETFMYENQLEALRDYSIVNCLDIAGYFQEREVFEKPEIEGFNAMIEQIEKGEANGILCWSLSNLTRKPNEIGKIINLMKNNHLTNIQTIAPSNLTADMLVPQLSDYYKITTKNE